MAPESVATTPIQVEVENIGGIDTTSVAFDPGVTVLVGRNATNRTSFLQAVMAAVGSDNVSLKADADAGTVELTVGGETFTRRLTRRDGTVRFDGEPYLDDSELADLFAFLLESNEARRAVERGEDLYDLIMRPVDTAEIDAEIDRLETEREGLAAELEELEELERRLPELEEDRTRIAEELEAKREALEEAEAAVEAIEAERDRSEGQAELEELREARHELEAVRGDVDDEARVVEALREEKAELESDLDGLAEADDVALEELEAEVRRHRESISSIESTVSELQSVIQFNESMVGGGRPEVAAALDGDGGEDGSVTDRLVGDAGDVVCWTCGTTVEADQIERTVELLQDAHREQVERRNELREEIDELEAERKHIERTREERDRLEAELREVRSELDERTDRLADLEDEAAELEATVDELEATVDELETEDRDELLARHRDRNQLEVEVDRLADELADIEAEIASIEERLAERDELVERRAAIDDEIDDLRSHIERLEATAVEQFNEQMDRLLELLEFENLERVWIDRKEVEVAEGRRRVSKTVFDLHVVRATASGSVYEDTVDHLSESEREVVGLVFALSGYLVHEVYETVPFMLIDSLEAIDAQRIPVLIDHLAAHAEHLVVALLPEDAAAVDDAYERVTEI